MTSFEIDFENLSLKDALDLAVMIEAEARDRYVELAGQMRMHQAGEAAVFFERMVEVEQLHHQMLLAQRQQLFGDAPTVLRPEQLRDIEAPRVDDARVHMTQRQALELALKAEEQAKDFFERLLKVVKNPEVAKLFAALRDEEVEHGAMVVHKLSTTPTRTPHLQAYSRG